MYSWQRALVILRKRVKFHQAPPSTLYIRHPVSSHNPGGRNYFNPCFTDEEMQVQIEGGPQGSHRTGTESRADSRADPRGPASPAPPPGVVPPAPPCSLQNTPSFSRRSLLAPSPSENVTLRSGSCTPTPISLRPRMIFTLVPPSGTSPLPECLRPLCQPVLLSPSCGHTRVRACP